MKDLVFYHAHCMDGTGAAAAYLYGHSVWDFSDKELTLKDIRYTDIESLEKFKEYLDKETNVVANDVDASNIELVDHPYITSTPLTIPQMVTFLDFCPTAEILKWLLVEGHTVLILDHHQTGREMMEKFLIDNEKLNLSRLHFAFGDHSISGSGLAYVLTEVTLDAYTYPSRGTRVNTFHHQMNDSVGFSIWNNLTHFEGSTSDMDKVFELLRVRDVWDISDPQKKKDADSLNAYLFHKDLTELSVFYKWWLSHFDLPTAISQGNLICEVFEKQIQEVIDRGYQTELNLTDGRKLQLCIASCPDKQASLMGDLWTQKWKDTEHPTICISMFTNYKTNRVGFGMRSNKHIDCKPLAEFLGGGGHFKACGGDLSTLVVPAGYDHVDYDVAVEPGQFIEKLRDELVYATTQVYKRV